MCIQCEALGYPPETVATKTFATRDEAIAYAVKKEWKYNVIKQLSILHFLGLVDMNARLDEHGIFI
jgi:hypothetical protein